MLSCEGWSFSSEWELEVALVGMSVAFSISDKSTSSSTSLSIQRSGFGNFGVGIEIYSKMADKRVRVNFAKFGYTISFLGMTKQHTDTWCRSICLVAISSLFL